VEAYERAKAQDLIAGVCDLHGCRAVVTDAGDKVLRFRSLVGLHCGGTRSSYPSKKFVAALSRWTAMSWPTSSSWAAYVSEFANLPEFSGSKSPML